MKKKTNITIDSNVAEMLEEYLINNKIGNRSKFIEKIVRKELKNRNKI